MRHILVTDSDIVWFDRRLLLNILQVKWIHLQAIHVQGGWISDCLPPDLMIAGRSASLLQSVFLVLLNGISESKNSVHLFL